MDGTATQKVWHDAALDLAKATWPLVNRHDAYGGFYVKAGAVEKTTRKDGLTKHRFLEHFTARWTENVIGLHCLSPGSLHGRFVVLDIDYHDPDVDDPELNERFAIHVHDTLAASGVRTIPLTWDGAGFHVWTIFRDPVPGHKLFALGEWLAGQAERLPKPVESFPKQSQFKTGKYGSWVRLFGMHPKRLTWPRVYNGDVWASGQAAVDAVMGGLQ